jgi:hypothetical protein
VKAEIEDGKHVGFFHVSRQELDIIVSDGKELGKQPEIRIAGRSFVVEEFFEIVGEPEEFPLPHGLGIHEKRDVTRKILLKLFRIAFPEKILRVDARQ